MSATPTNLSLSNQNTLVIDWSDGSTRRYDVNALRQACPCATCRSDPPAPDLEVTIAQMIPVGNYAYAIRFSDGHDTGIYTLELLHELGEPQD